MCRAARSLLLLSALLAGAAQCSLLVEDDLGRVRCAQEGRVGAPACDPGQLCALGRCQVCVAVEVCDDGIDNDCDGRPDQGCAPEAAAGGAGGAGGVTGSGSARPDSN